MCNGNRAYVKAIVEASKCLWEIVFLKPQSWPRLEPYYESTCFAIPSASHRGAKLGIPWKCSRKCSRGVLQGVLSRVLREIGGAPGSAPESALSVDTPHWAALPEAPRFPGALSGAPPEAPRFPGAPSRALPRALSRIHCDWRMGLQHLFFSRELLGELQSASPRLPTGLLYNFSNCPKPP